MSYSFHSNKAQSPDMLAELHAESGIQPVQIAGQAPGLFGQHVCDESIIDFLKNCQFPDGPYVHAKPVC
jgi:hypothetical protein